MGVDERLPVRGDAAEERAGLEIVVVVAPPAEPALAARCGCAQRVHLRVAAEDLEPDDRRARDGDRRLVLGAASRQPNPFARIQVGNDDAVADPGEPGAVETERRRRRREPQQRASRSDRTSLGAVRTSPGDEGGEHQPDHGAAHAPRLPTSLALPLSCVPA